MSQCAQIMTDDQKVRPITACHSSRCRSTRCT